MASERRCYVPPQPFRVPGLQALQGAANRVLGPARPGLTDLGGSRSSSPRLGVGGVWKELLTDWDPSLSCVASLPGNDSPHLEVSR